MKGHPYSISSNLHKSAAKISQNNIESESLPQEAKNILLRLQASKAKLTQAEKSKYLSIQEMLLNSDSKGKEATPTQRTVERESEGASYETKMFHLHRIISVLSLLIESPAINPLKQQFRTNSLPRLQTSAKETAPEVQMVLANFQGYDQNLQEDLNFLNRFEKGLSKGDPDQISTSKANPKIEFHKRANTEYQPFPAQYKSQLEEKERFKTTPSRPHSRNPSLTLGHGTYGEGLTPGLKPQSHRPNDNPRKNSSMFPSLSSPHINLNKLPSYRPYKHERIHTINSSNDALPKIHELNNTDLRYKNHQKTAPIIQPEVTKNIEYLKSQIDSSRQQGLYSSSSSIQKPFMSTRVESNYQPYMSFLKENEPTLDAFKQNHSEQKPRLRVDQGNKLNSIVLTPVQKRRVPSARNYNIQIPSNRSISIPNSNLSEIKDLPEPPAETSQKQVASIDFNLPKLKFEPALMTKKKDSLKLARPASSKKIQISLPKRGEGKTEDKSLSPTLKGYQSNAQVPAESNEDKTKLLIEILNGFDDGGTISSKKFSKAQAQNNNMVGEHLLVNEGHMLNDKSSINLNSEREKGEATPEANSLKKTVSITEPEPEPAQPTNQLMRRGSEDDNEPLPILMPTVPIEPSDEFAILEYERLLRQVSIQPCFDIKSQIHSIDPEFDIRYMTVQIEPEMESGYLEQFVFVAGRRKSEVLRVISQPRHARKASQATSVIVNGITKQELEELMKATNSPTNGPTNMLASPRNRKPKAYHPQPKVSTELGPSYKPFIVKKDKSSDFKILFEREDNANILTEEKMKSINELSIEQSSSSDEDDEVDESRIIKGKQAVKSIAASSFLIDSDVRYRIGSNGTLYNETGSNNHKNSINRETYFPTEMKGIMSHGVGGTKDRRSSFLNPLLERSIFKPQSTSRSSQSISLSSFDSNEGNPEYYSRLRSDERGEIKKRNSLIHQIHRERINSSEKAAEYFQRYLLIGDSINIEQLQNHQEIPGVNFIEFQHEQDVLGDGRMVEVKGMSALIWKDYIVGLQLIYAKYNKFGGHDEIQSHMESGDLPEQLKYEKEGFRLESNEKVMEIYACFEERGIHSLKFSTTKNNVYCLGNDRFLESATMIQIQLALGESMNFMSGLFKSTSCCSNCSRNPCSAVCSAGAAAYRIH